MFPPRSFVAFAPYVTSGALTPNACANGASPVSGVPPVGGGASLAMPSKAPRIHGWMRQKYASLPAGRSAGVDETPVGLPFEIGSQPSVPESQRPSASG